MQDRILKIVRRERLLAWWYACIGVAFVLLGARSAVQGDLIWKVVFRFVIAVGFVVLAVGTFRRPLR
jgi:hypothetical protein